MDMKNTAEITHLSLFSGIGGLDLAAEWAGFKTVGQCEWAEYPTKVLEKHWPDVPRWQDIRTLTKESFYEKTGRRTVDIISGGFPCQPFSTAGQQRGKEDDRYLWPEMVRIIQELRPAWIVGENVAGIVRMALPDILSELETCGYRARAFLVPACAVGARHRRYRVAIVGCRTGYLENPDSLRCGEQRNVCKQQRRTEPERSGKDVAHPESNSPRRLPRRTSETEPGSGGGCKDVQYANCSGCQEQHPTAEPDFKAVPNWKYYERYLSDADHHKTTRYGKDSGKIYKEPETKRSCGCGSTDRSTKSGLGGMADGIPDWVDGYWDTEPVDVPRVAPGVKNRVGRLKALGNAVVPQQFYPIFRAIAKIIWEGIYVKEHPTR